METTTLTIAERNAAVAGGVAGATVGIFFMCAFILYILTIIATWKIFKKAGEPGWKCLIPIYNIYIMYKIVGMKGWFWGILITTLVCSLIISLDSPNYVFVGANSNTVIFDASKHIPTVIAVLVMLVVDIWGSALYDWRTSKAFGHGIGYFLGLFFFQPIFWLIIGFGNSKYDKKFLKK